MTEQISINDKFPQVEDINVSVNARFYLIGGVQQQTRTYTKSNLPRGIIRCRSEVCEGGGVPLEDIFRSMLTRMVRSKLEEDTDIVHCEGHEDMGNHNTRACHVTVVEIKTQIKYRELETDKS